MNKTYKVETRPEGYSKVVTGRRRRTGRAGPRRATAGRPARRAQ